MTRNRASRTATLLLRLLLSTKERNFLDLARWSVLFRLRRTLVQLGDPIVEYELYGTKLRIPLSHNLPLILRSYPLYSDNLGRIAAHIFAKYRDLTVVDIGANVGDSVVIIHRRTRVPILCIEGEPRFAGLLAENIAATAPAPEIERSFVGAAGDSLVAVVHDGTARLERKATDDASAVPIKSLEQILRERPNFQNARLLKVDTDGMDVAILKSSLNWISRQRPVLFFEYDPCLQLAHGESGLELLNDLHAAGYRQALVYESNGDYMFSAELGNTPFFSELHEYFSGRGSMKYCDLCIFHEADQDLAEIIRGDELKVFQAARNYPPASSGTAAMAG